MAKQQQPQISTTRLVEWYMSQYNIPTGTADERTILITSEDILRAINDMVDLSINDVATTLLSLGYKAEYVEGQHGWRVALKEKQ